MDQPVKAGVTGSAAGAVVVVVVVVGVTGAAVNCTVPVPETLACPLAMT